MDAARVVAGAIEQLACDEIGPGDAAPIVLLHGITGSRHYFDQAVQRLAGSRRLIVPDLPGFGESPKPPLRYDLAAYVGAVRSLLEARGLAGRPIDVVAHSLGALVTLDYAVRHPGHVRRAVLLSVPCHADAREAHEHFLAGSGNYRRLLGRASLVATVRSWLRAGPSMALRYSRAFSRRIAQDSRSWTFHSLTSTIRHCLLEHRVQETVRRLFEIPEAQRPALLLLHGDRDQVAPLARVQELHAEMPGTALRVIRGTGHHPLRTHARECLGAVESFLAGAA